MLDFAKLAEYSTGRAPKLAGILPPLKTVFLLLSLSVIMATGLWAWAGFWTGVYASLSGFLPFIGQGLAATLGITLVNFWFGRDINAAILATRDARDIMKYAESTSQNEIELNKLVNHIRHEVNAYFRQKLGANHRDIPVPLLLTYTDDANFKIVTIEGRNQGTAALIFSSSVFDTSRMDQRHLAALIEKELIKIYLRRGVSRTIIGMMSDLSTTLQSFNASPLFVYKMLGLLASPLNFFTLIERSINRSYEYEASSHVVACGRGVDLVGAMDRKVNRNQRNFPMKATLNDNLDFNKRDPYQGRGPVKWIADWIDRYEYANADKSGLRIVALGDILVNYTLFFVNELWNKLPRSTNEKSHVLKNIKANINGVEISMDSKDATEETWSLFDQQNREKNRPLYDQVVNSIAAERAAQLERARVKAKEEWIPYINNRFQAYAPISPEGNGINILAAGAETVAQAPIHIPAQNQDQAAQPILHARGLHARGQAARPVVASTHGMSLRARR